MDLKAFAPDARHFGLFAGVEKLRFGWALVAALGLDPTALSAGTIGSGSVSGAIIYSRAGVPNGTIWMAAGDGSSDVQITAGEHPKLSPDGRYIAFKRDGATYYYQDKIWVHDLLTGQETRILDNSDYIVAYSWTPDGQRLLFDYSCDVEVVNLDGSNRHSFFGGNCYDDVPSVNTVDGSVAFHNTQGGGGIGIVQADGGNRHFVPNTSPADVWPSWSADGKWIAFVNGPNFFKIQPDGSGRTQLTTLTNSGDVFNFPGAWTGDGSALVAAGTIGGDNALFSIATDGSGLTQRLKTSPGAALDFVGSVGKVIDLSHTIELNLTLSAQPNPVVTNSVLTYTLSLSNLGPGSASGVRLTNELAVGAALVSANASAGTVLSAGNLVSLDLPSLAAGSSVALTVKVLASTPGILTNVATVTANEPELNAAVTNSSLRTMVVGAPVLSGIFYSQAGSPNGTVWLAAPDGSTDQLLTTGEQPRLSPDGRYLLFKRDNADYSRASVYVRDLQSGVETKVYNDTDFVVGYSWTADSSQIVLDFSCAIYAMNRDGSNFHLVIGGDCYDDAPSVSLTDGTIAFHNIHSGLWLADASGSNKHQIPNTRPGDIWPVWSPDGQWITFSDGTNAFKIYPDGSQRTQLTFLSAAPDKIPGPLTWSPDGATLLGAAVLQGAGALAVIALDGSGTINRIVLPGNAIPDFVGTLNAPIGAPAAVPVPISVIQRLVQGQIQLTVASETNRTYVVQASMNLRDWATILSKTASTNLLDLVDMDAPKFPLRFYRAFKQP